MKFGVVIIAPEKYVHSHAFDEVADAVHSGLTGLGHDSVRLCNEFAAGAVNIVFGANILAAAGGQPKPPPASILFNLEQIVDGSGWLSAAYLDLLRRYRVWDYSRANIAALARLGVEAVTCVPIGYERCLTRIPDVKQDIDVLFYGSINDRRMKVLDDLRLAGANLHAVFGAYGSKRDELIARARIVLNVHYYESKVFEIVRVSYLLANRRFVISERGTDREEERPFDGGLVFCDYDELVARCLDFLQRDDERDKVAQRGFDLMRARRQAEFLAPAIARL